LESEFFSEFLFKDTRNTSRKKVYKMASVLRAITPETSFNIYEGSAACPLFDGRIREGPTQMMLCLIRFIKI